MSLVKQIVIDSIDATENGSVNVRTATRVIEDGVQISVSYHRHVILPGQDYSAEDARVQAVCQAVQTSEVIAAYQAAQAAQGV